MVLLVPRRDFFLVSPNALSAATDCRVLVDRWFRPHFAVDATFGIVGLGLQRSNALGSALL